MIPPPIIKSKRTDAAYAKELSRRAILNLITSAAQDGNKHCNIFRELTEEETNDLHNRGFTLNYHKDKFDSYTQIKW